MSAHDDETHTSRPVRASVSAASSRRNSHGSGPRPITRAEYSGKTTPSILSRAGSPTLPLGGDKNLGHHIQNALSSLAFTKTEKKVRQGEFVASVDCGTT
jgi:glycerol kinase